MTLLKSWPWLFVAGCFLCGCKSITHSSPEFKLPPATVILSFDDGPNARDDTTIRLLDILKKYEIHAMFALLGENAEEYPDLVRRIHDDGHYIINHGYADKWAQRMNDREFRDNLARGEAAISAALGRTLGTELSPKLYRPHGGFYNSRQEKICQEAGYTIIPAGIRVYDAVLKGKERGKMYSRTIEKIEKHNGGIVLLHDARGSHHHLYDRSWFPDTVEEIIVTLLDRGFTVGSPGLIIPKYP